MTGLLMYLFLKMYLEINQSHQLQPSTTNPEKIKIMKNQITQKYPLRLVPLQQVKMHNPWEFKQLYADHVGLTLIVIVSPYTKMALQQIYIRCAALHNLTDELLPNSTYIGFAILNGQNCQVYRIDPPPAPRQSLWQRLKQRIFRKAPMLCFS